MEKDESGNPIKSTVLENRNESVVESARLTPSEQLALRTFHKAAAEFDKCPLDLNSPQVELKNRRNVYYGNSTQDNPDSKRKAFRRARSSLQAKGWLTVENDIYTLTLRGIGT